MKVSIITFALVFLVSGSSALAQTDYKSWAEVALLPDIEKAKVQVEQYNPHDQLRLVSEALHPWLYRAVSLQARNAYYNDKGVGLKPYLDPALDALAAAAKQKLPGYVPGPTNFSFHNAVEEKMITTNVKTQYNQVIRTGLVNSTWRIDKNEFGIPRARYKWGKAYVKVIAPDYPYCWLESVNIVQDYAGGGTYGKSYANWVGEELVGCPAGK